jgi:hypothetical protein
MAIKYYPPLKAGEKPPVPGEGHRYVLFRPHGSKNLSAHIVMPDGHKEVIKTGFSEGSQAIVPASKRVFALYKERKIERPSDIRRRTGELSPYKKLRLARGLPVKGVPPLTEARDEDAPLESGPSPIEPSGSNGSSSIWATTLVRIENKFSQGFQRIMNLILLGVGADDPAEFREHVRAIVAEVALQGITPMGRIKKRRGPRGAYGPRS